MTKNIKIVHAFVAPHDSKWQNMLVAVAEDGRVLYADTENREWKSLMPPISQRLEIQTLEEKTNDE